MYKEKLKFDSQVFHDSEALAVKTYTIDRGLRAQGAEGRLKVTVRAVADGVVLDSATTMTMTLTESATESGTYAALNPTISRVKSWAADQTYVKNESIMDCIVPLDDLSNKWIKPTLVVGGTLGDTAGNIEVILEYLAN